MKSSNANLRLASILVLASIACVPAVPKDGGLREARAAIEAANTRFSDAFGRGDAQAVAGMYTSDAIVFPPDSEMIRGPEAIGEFWRSTRNGGVTSATLETVDLEINGDMACEVGKVSLTIQPEGQAATTAAAKYLVVWKRQADGSWKLHRDIWNGLTPQR